jgi:hypothetical protein
MRGILSKILIAGTLLSGGIASADTWRGRDDGGRDHAATVADRDHRDGDGAAFRRDRDGGRDDDRPPAPKVERHRERRGAAWLPGQWIRKHGRWSWQPGHYVRLGRAGAPNGRY